MTFFEQYRPPGRSNRSGRNTDNDVFEGLPVKQWGFQAARISLAPPVAETADGNEDKWGEPPMPRDSSLLQPWTQQLLRLARSGKVGSGKRKNVSSDPLDGMDEDRGEGEEAADDAVKTTLEDRGYVAKKWKAIPESLLVPESKHFEFLAKRRKGLPSIYGAELSAAAVVPMRRTKVRRTAAPAAEGLEAMVTIYEVLLPEGQVLEGEITDLTEMAELKPTSAVPGTVIEGLGIANDDGIIVAEHLKPSLAAPRRSRPPPKRKGGPGRGKKRVTFTNPDGSTYTAIVPNATKIVAQPGQTVKHVAKGEEAAADINQVKTEATVQPSGEGEGVGEGEVDQQAGEGEGEGEGEEEGSEEGEEGEEDDDDEQREEGELSDEDAPTAGATPAPAPASAVQRTAGESAAEDPPSKPEAAKSKGQDAQDPDTASTAEPAPEPAAKQPPSPRDASSSPELPLAQTNHSRHNSLEEKSAPEAHETEPVAQGEDTEMSEAPPREAPEGEESGEAHDDGDEKAEDAAPEGRDEGERAEGGEEEDEDLLGDLEKHLEG
ncbi:hypothetical protein B0A50_06464 [Salinomyces thailandicus]|uniref:Uncharacterized protein n=1 Tax=Salinomyces thailandicus TaxID=706561 RepID=A0A4U0TPH7_9PEZI|nr:hypothetical protein B0A50_06464 [Salinomyces thailandica]